MTNQNNLTDNLNHHLTDSGAHSITKHITTAPLKLNNVYFNLKKSVQMQLLEQDHRWSKQPIFHENLLSDESLDSKAIDAQALNNTLHSNSALRYALNTMAQMTQHADGDLAQAANNTLNEKGIQVLPEYLFVKQLVEQNFPAIFLTGGAGTGKSTFIQWLCREYRGEVLLGAPTAMAAINVGGRTLHSMFQLPPAWIVKQDIKPGKKREIKKAKLLIIDEISMVTANLLDGVSAYLRLNRGIDKPFGGLTVVMVGDLFQLPPVIDEKTRPMFEQVYGSPKFYNARSLKSIDYCAIELTQTYRQTEQDFVQLLCHVREGQRIAESIEQLNQQCLISSTPPQGAVWLSPRNAEVERKNKTELAKIDAALFRFEGELEGEFKLDRLPSPLHLQLKQGAQVMFTQNDPKRRWYNGTVGHITVLSEQEIVVTLQQTGEKLTIEKAVWSEYHYQWNAATQQIERFEVGSYTQYPLVLAWAMTIHKSQGRTIDKVHLALGKGAFETGQTYVALSRCRTLDGLSLSRELRASDIMVDVESVSFYQQLREGNVLLSPHS